MSNRTVYLFENGDKVTVFQEGDKVKILGSGARMGKLSVEPDGGNSIAVRVIA